MAKKNWQEESNERVGGSWTDIIPIFPLSKPHFESTYVDKNSGAEVTGKGDTPEEARENAQKKLY